MLNLTDSVTISGKARSAVDPQTGIPTLSDQAVVTNARCAFAVLSAADHEQAWGEGDAPTQTNAVTASLILPNYVAPLVDPLDAYSVSVAGYVGTFRVISSRPGAQRTTYQLAQ